MSLICLPGMNRDQKSIGEYELRHAVGCFDHGWPVTFLSRKIDSYTRSRFREVAAGPAPWLSLDGWRGGAVTNFSIASLFIDLAVCCTVLIVVVTAWEYRRRKRASVWQASLQEMFGASFIIAAILGWLVYEVRESSREARQFAALYDLEEELWGEGPNVMWTRKPDLPDWMIRLFGPKSVPESMWRCRKLALEPNSAGDYSTLAEAMPYLSELTRADFLSVHVPVESAELPANEIAELGHVRFLELYSYSWKEGWQIKLDDLRKLRHLELIIFPRRSSLSEEGVEFLNKEMPSCRVKFGVREVESDGSW